MIKVSIICNAFNHEKYIRKCLEGFVSQNTDFEYEVLIHDDASTDGTPEVIKEFEAKYPNVIKPIFQKTNQYSQGIPITIRYQFPRVNGKYIAICEGDDYWCDENKLQIQVDALEQHNELDMCAHHADVFTRGKKSGEIGPKQDNIILPLEQVILGGGGILSTNSLVFRRDLINKNYRFRNFYSIDYSLQIMGAIRGGILYFGRTMSVYNYMTEGSWTSRISSDNDKHINHVTKTIEMLRILNEETMNAYSTPINERIKQLEFYIYKVQSDFNNAKKYKELYEKMKFSEKTKLFIKSIIKKRQR